ncbi:hypothetical protein Tsubulata_007130 [Turnera subulata]|uniref:Uncharacterized protein n=1 Tax=Turnera subulata TaxID=218843 RepID=A0A9Q0J1J0_9ROSI|nr:hypothetical protein Tsubulata_007130 [Turnera subulata]
MAFLARSNALNRQYLQDLCASTRKQHERSAKSVRTRFFRQKENRIQLEPNRNHTSQKKVSDGLEKQHSNLLKEMTKTVAEIEASYDGEYLPRTFLGSKLRSLEKASSSVVDHEKQTCTNFPEKETEDVSVASTTSLDDEETKDFSLDETEAYSHTENASKHSIILLETEENEALDQNEEDEAFDNRTVKKVQLDDAKKVTQTFKKTVVFDESRNTIRWFEVGKPGTISHMIDDNPQETNEYANMTDEELHSRCEEFIQRFTMQMRQQGPVVLQLKRQ